MDNLKLEIGQLVFVLIGAFLTWLWQRLGIKGPPPAVPAPATPAPATPLPTIDPTQPQGALLSTLLPILLAHLAPLLLDALKKGLPKIGDEVKS